MKTTFVKICTVLVTLGLVTAARAADEHDALPVDEAVAVIVPTKASKSDTAGVIMLKQKDGYVQVTGEVTGLTPGEHGFHIHMYGDLRADDGTSAGGHYNPHGKPHGGPDSKEHHVGDMGNIKANADGVAKVSAKADGNLHHMIGRSIVVHGGVDDLKSQPSGDAGPRVGIGVIGLAQPAPATAAK
ncbi:MAG: superoxide dismutase family protein [Planctomycetota bacterium]|nr:MAG: superoxide dismutase family protein [Planctomycetota bacterium]